MIGSRTAQNRFRTVTVLRFPPYIGGTATRTAEPRGIGSDPSAVFSFISSTKVRGASSGRARSGCGVYRRPSCETWPMYSTSNASLLRSSTGRSLVWPNALRSWRLSISDDKCPSRSSRGVGIGDLRMACTETGYTANREMLRTLHGLFARATRSTQHECRARSRHVSSGATAPRPRTFVDEMKPWRRPPDECPIGRVEAFGARPRAAFRLYTAISKVFRRLRVSGHGGRRPGAGRKRKTAASSLVITTSERSVRKVAALEQQQARAIARGQLETAARIEARRLELQEEQ